MSHHHHHDHDHGRSGPAPRRAAFGGFGGPGPRGAFGGFGPRFGQQPFGRRGGGRARRGNVRAAVLALLTERPMHGYEIIQELDARTQGIWRPSAGSVYPTLQLLEDEGLITGADQDGKRAYTLTEAGRAAAAERGDGPAPWDELLEGVDPGAQQLREQAMALGGAVAQVLHTGQSAQRASAAEILGEARRRIYALLAEEGDVS